MSAPFGKPKPRVRAKGDKYSKGNRPSFLTRKQAEAFDRERRNFNRRIDYQVKKWQKEYPDATMEELGRLGVTSFKYTKQLNDLESLTQYRYMMKLFKSTKTKKYKAKFKKDMRERLKEVIAQAYFPAPEVMKTINRILDGMSEADLIRFNYDNRELVSDTYLEYTENMDAEGPIDADKYEEDILRLLEALAPYDKRVRR